MYYVVWCNNVYVVLTDDEWADVVRGQVNKAAKGVKVDYFVVCACDDEREAQAMCMVLNMAGI